MDCQQPQDAKPIDNISHVTATVVPYKYSLREKEGTLYSVQHGDPATQSPELQRPGHPPLS